MEQIRGQISSFHQVWKNLAGRDLREEVGVRSRICGTLRGSSLSESSQSHKKGQLGEGK